jgi:hypothetical protein
MRSARTAVITVVTLVAFGTGRVEAGAPNYECQAGPYRLGIDQHRNAGLVRDGRGPVVPMTFTDTDQNGPSLDLSAQIGRDATTVRVRGTGSSVQLHIAGKRYAGVCAFVPGDFALGRVTARKLVARRSPAEISEVVAVLHRGSLIWSQGGFDETTKQVAPTGWIRVRVVLALHGGSRSGGEQQLGMGATAGLDAASSLFEGWVRTTSVAMLGPPGP